MQNFTAEKRRGIDNILGFLFDMRLLQSSSKRDNPVLAKLPPVHQLPYGPEHRTQQYMLETVCQEEASYEGNYAITLEILRQLRLSDPEKLENWARQHSLPTVGDALTIARLRMLQFMKAEDLSILQRLEYLITVFGWLHLDMNFCNAILYHHFGKSLASGLARDAAVSHRAGLKEPTKKNGPLYHIVHEFLQHSTTARFLGLWLDVTASKTLEELAEWVEVSEPETVYEAAERIWLERASNRALKRFGDDPNLCNAIALNRDLLLQHEVLVSTKTGDVGRMENTLPSLLLFFSGAGSKNYARELAETMHWMRYEAPPGVTDLIRDECWVLNTRGLANTFYPFDLHQELNNLSIKEHGPPPTGCTWDAHRRWSPALPVFTAVVQHIDECFHNFYRSRKHYVPDAEQDINLFIARHNELKIHEYNPNRPETKKEKRAHDCFAAGRVNIMEKNYLGQLALEREQYLRNRSTLDLAQHMDVPLEETLQQMALKHTQAGNQNANMNQIIQSLFNDTEEQGSTGDDLFFENHEPEANEEGERAYEETRHMLGDGWGA
ncbi:hypothetical protein FS749_012574 [Ceratobasidium sp. UAMH 11750]|nr:hypothetical protein FS749_012574 [Ceratobasidium sp. UAMH 11750]